jgi:magnesium transporter
VDEYRHLIGTVSATELLLADRSAEIADIMNPDVIAVDCDLDQEEVVRVAQEYDLVVVPVIDKHLRLAGRITIDDLVDVLYEEHNEDLGQFAGTGGEEVLETSIIRTTRERLPWLFLSMVGGFMAALVMNGFGRSLSVMPETAYFIPLIAAFGGNVGIQSSSIMVRGLATGAIKTTDLLVRLWKELRVGALNGAICAVLLALMNWMITRNIATALSAGVALVAVVCIAASIGASVPILLKQLNIDPALATGPFITTANDILGISIYLGITFNVSHATWLS